MPDVLERRTLPYSSRVKEDSTYFLWVLLARTRDAVYRARQKDLSESGLTAEQSFVLNIIQRFVDQGMADKITPAELSRQMFRESQSVSELLHRMEWQGLVTRVRDLHRRNMVRIELTEKGRNQFEAAMSAESIGRIMSRLTPEQSQQFVTCLTIVREAALDELGVDDVPISIDYEGRPNKRSRRRRVRRTPEPPDTIAD